MKLQFILKNYHHHHIIAYLFPEIEVKGEQSVQSAESSVASSVQSCLSLEDISALYVTHQYTLHKRLLVLNSTGNCVKNVFIYPHIFYLLFSLNQICTPRIKGG